MLAVPMQVDGIAVKSSLHQIMKRDDHALDCFCELCLSQQEHSVQASRKQSFELELQHVWHYTGFILSGTDYNIPESVQVWFPATTP